MASRIRFEIRRSNNAAQPYFWRIVAVGNNAILAWSETYVNKQDVIDVVNAVKTDGAAAEFIDYSG